MRYTRENILNLRKKLIKYCSDTSNRDIEFLTDKLLDYPTMVEAVTELAEVSNQYIKSEYISTGHGAFGEPEGYSIRRVCGSGDLDNRRVMVFLDSEGVPVFACNRDIENLIDIAKEAHSNSFTI
jgi:hypothetical protein